MGRGRGKVTEQGRVTFCRTWELYGQVSREGVGRTRTGLSLRPSIQYAEPTHSQCPLCARQRPGGWGSQTRRQPALRELTLQCGETDNGKTICAFKNLDCGVLGEDFEQAALVSEAASGEGVPAGPCWELEPLVKDRDWLLCSIPVQLVIETRLLEALLGPDTLPA